MRLVVQILEWIVLLPIWRRIIKPKPGYIAAAVVTGFVWIIVIAAVAGGGGDDKSSDDSLAANVTDSPVPNSETPADATPVPSAVETPALTTAPTEEPTAPPTDAPSASNKAAAVPGAVAEAEHIRVYMNQIIDPWLSDNQFIQPAEGNRFVTFDVTIEDFDDDGTHYAGAFNFHLSDAESFAYEATFWGPEPRLSGVEVHAGEKTRGWVTFEINATAAMKSLKYDPNFLTTKDIEFSFE